MTHGDGSLRPECSFIVRLPRSQLSRFPPRAWVAGTCLTDLRGSIPCGNALNIYLKIRYSYGAKSLFLIILAISERPRSTARASDAPRQCAVSSGPTWRLPCTGSGIGAGGATRQATHGREFFVRGFERQVLPSATSEVIHALRDSGGDDATATLSFLDIFGAAGLWSPLAVCSRRYFFAGRLFKFRPN